MKRQYDFSKGEHSKFYREDMQLHLPVYLSNDAQTTLAELANAKSTELLKKNIELIKMSS